MQLVHDSNPDLKYKPMFFKPESTQGTTPLQVEKNLWESSWWLNPKTINDKAQCIHIGKDSQLFMGDCECTEQEIAEAVILLLYDPFSQKIFNMAKPNQGVVMGPNGEAQMLDDRESKHVLTEVK